MKTDNEADNLDELAADPAPDAEQTDDVTPDSSTGEGEEAQGSPASETEKHEEVDASKDAKANRERLIDALTTGKMGEDDEATSDDESEGDESEAEEGVADAAPETTAAAKDDKSEKKDDAVDEDDEPLPRGTHPKTVQRIQKLLKEKKEMKPLAEYGQSMFDFMHEAKLIPEDVKFLLEMGAKLRANPSAGASEMYAFAKAVAEKHNAKLPEPAPVVKEVVPAKLREELDDIINDAIIDAGLSPEVAKKIRAKIRENAAAAGTVTPTPTPPTATTPIQPPAPTQPAQPEITQAQIEAASRAIAAVQAKAAKEMPTDWPKLRADVDKQMAQYAGTPPHLWSKFYANEIEVAKAKRIKPPVRPASQTLRPSTATSVPASKQNNPRASALDLLTGRKKG
jgi:hypothetical protein